MRSLGARYRLFACNRRGDEYHEAFFESMAEATEASVKLASAGKAELFEIQSYPPEEAVGEPMRGIYFPETSSTSGPAGQAHIDWGMANRRTPVPTRHG